MHGTSAYGPPRLAGIVLIALGGLTTYAGIGLGGLGNGADFLVQGAGIILSGVLVYLGLIAGIWVYFLTQLVVLVWTLVGYGAGAAIPRVAVPILIGLLLCRDNVRSRLR